MLRPRIVGALTLAAVAASSCLLMMSCASGVVVTSLHPTAFAVLCLLLSLPLVDSALLGSSVRPEVAGLCLGLPAGFLARQAMESPRLSQGVDGIVATAAVVSLGLAGWRLWARRRQRA